MCSSISSDPTQGRPHSRDKVPQENLGPGDSAFPRKPLPPALDLIRRRGWRGGIITPHRAFVRLHLGTRQIVETVALTMLGTGAWIALLPAIGRFWGYILAFWSRQLNLRSEVTLVPQAWGGLHFVLPTFGLAAGSASGSVWWITAAITTAAFAASFALGEEAVPWAYLIRGLCLLQATALAYFTVAAARFPHDLPSYIISMLLFSCILIGLVPILYAFTFYPLDFTLPQKILLTLVTMGHFVLFIPHQYMLHVYLVHKSVLFMPLAYFVFGPFLDILAFIGFYSWGMSWKAPTEGT